MRRLVLLLALLATASAWAAPVSTRYSTVELIAEQSTLPSAGGTVTLGLYIRPNPTWHAYWTNPGDAGQAPSIEWTMPEGFAASEFEFPAPHVLPFGDLNTYGYDGEILLLTEISVPAGLSAGDEISLGGRARWVVCDDKVCVPDRAVVSLKLSVGEAIPNPEMAPRFAEARGLIPTQVEWPGEFSIGGSEVSIEIAPADAREGFDDAYLFIESTDLVGYARQSYGMTSAGLTFKMDAVEGRDTPDRTNVILAYTAADGSHKAVSLDLVQAVAAPVSGSSPGGLSFIQAVIFAFLGGIILNLMPCVFPILSMKAMSLVKMARENQRATRESGVLYTVGILVAFTAIAVVMLTFRSAGESVGWGFQMQNPLIVVGIGLLMVAVGVNLLGAFEFGTRIMGTGQGLVSGGERREAFFTGLLAVVVATPCMAPFMASALGYALTQPAAISVAVFLALGFGLAFPYLLVSFVPAFGRIMPKPGAWMETFKHLLAFPMFITALWLFWIVGRQLGPTSMFVGLLSAVAIAFTLWAYGKAQYSGLKKRWYVTAVVGLALSIYAVSQVESVRVIHRADGDTSAGMLGGLELEHFDPERVRQYIADGQPTFVYFTADWCISCKANERVALSTNTVAEAFNSRGIKVVEGDWTMEDPVITEWLEMYDRAGVPLYLYFPKGSSLETVTILPQILTPGLVVDAIVAADSGQRSRLRRVQLRKKPTE